MSQVLSQKEIENKLAILIEDFKIIQTQIASYSKLILIAEDSAIGLKIQIDALSQQLKQVKQSKLDENKNLRSIEIDRLKFIMPQLLKKLPDKL